MLIPQNDYEQLTAGLRTKLLSDAIFYADESRFRHAPISPFQPLRPMTGANYVAYKKAAVLAASRQKRPGGIQVPQSVIVTDLQSINAAICR
jgi:hypothetical protein